MTERKLNHLVWSHTAPAVTQEEVEAERRALSDEERRQIDDDIYGVDEPILETPQLIADMIEKMNIHIDEIDEDDKESYLTAQEKCPEYCNSEDFRLMFLRADKFDAEKAANRLVEYWEEKLDLFGAERTYSRISIDDLNANPFDAEALESGALYILPEKDAAGRGILFGNRTKLVQPQFSRESKMRVLFYLVHCLAEDDKITQKKGVVVLFTPPQESLLKLDRKFAKFAFKGSGAFFPVRCAACHIAVPAISLVSLVFLPVWYQLLGRDLRDRLVTHRFVSSLQETHKKFQEHGIKSASLPTELGGTVNYNYDAWLDQRRAREEAR